MTDWTTRFSLSGRTALVTGASKGIGAEICSVFADAGADIVAVARDASGLAATAEAVQDHGRQCHTLVCDLGDRDAVDALATEALALVPRIDILVNNAGIARVASALDMALDEWDEIMAVNLRAPFQLARALAPGMIEQNWGKVVNISSQAGVIGLPDHTAYSASKAGMNAMTRGLMVEWAPHNVQVNVICPTVILTPMGLQVWGEEAKARPMLERTPLGRFGQPVEVADLALFLASDASALINGESILIDGGFSAI